MALLPVSEPPDCWQLVGDEDDSTPPTVARVLNRVGTRPEWRRAGFPVLFDGDGRVRHVMRVGRLYRFERVSDEEAAAKPHPSPLN
jgi:hypothetical protein